MLAVIALPTEEAGGWASAGSAWMGFRVAAVEGVVRGVVGAAAMVADHGGGGSGAVSNHMTELMALVALGQGRAVIKLTGPAVGPEKGRGGATD
jgi:hypothetical protein